MTSLRRSWSGLDAELVETPAGLTRTRGSRRHCVGFHVGRSVRATCHVDGQKQARIQLRGDADLVPAGAPGAWEDDRSTRILRLLLTPELLQSAALGLGLNPDRVELQARLQLRDPRLSHIAWALEAELNSEAPSEALYGESLAVALAAHLVSQYRSAPGVVREMPRGLTPAQLRLVSEYIEAHLDRPLHLAELAGIAKVSVSHFKTLFKRTTGLAVHQYVVRQRLERARALLLRDGESVAEVALRTGFSDQSHLARWMRRVLGTSPSHVRRSAR